MTKRTQYPTMNADNDRYENDRDDDDDDDRDDDGWDDDDTGSNMPTHHRHVLLGTRYPQSSLPAEGHHVGVGSGQQQYLRHVESD